MAPRGPCIKGSGSQTVGGEETFKKRSLGGKVRQDSGRRYKYLISPGNTWKLIFQPEGVYTSLGITVTVVA